MSRRSTPERIDAARHAAVRNSLISDGLSAETADAVDRRVGGTGGAGRARARLRVLAGGLGVDRRAT
jgi:hypothetical protein